MVATPEHYAAVIDAFRNPESLTVLVVSGTPLTQVAAALGVDLSTTTSPDDVYDLDEQTAWSLLDVPGGVLAVEPTGYGDPSRSTLAELSVGGAAAVVRHNVQGHARFGCARSGEVLFDDDEYMYIEDPEAVPGELRPLFDLVWDDLESDVAEDDDGPGPWEVGLAMAETITGIELTQDQAVQVEGSEHHPAPWMQYVGPEG